MNADLRMSREAFCHFRIYKGHSRAGMPARLVYVGMAEGLLYVAPFVGQCFFEHSSVDKEGTFEWAQLEGFINQNQADMILLMASTDVVQQCQRSSDIVGLSRIHQKVDVSAGWKAVLEQFSNRENKRHAQLVEQGFYFDVSLEDEHFFSFYRSMHVPTMSARYGPFARSVQEQAAYLEFVQARNVVPRPSE